MDEETPGLGPCIRARRQALGMRQQALADAAGMSRAYLSQVENNRKAWPNPVFRRKIAAALGLRHVDLLIAARELRPDEIRGFTAVRSPAQLLAERIEALPPDARRSVEFVVGQYEEAAAARRLSPPAAAPAPAS